MKGLERGLGPALLAALVLTACGSSGNESSSSEQSAAGGAVKVSASAADLEKNLGKGPGTEFCGTKQIKLGIHDGLGLNARDGDPLAH